MRPLILGDLSTTIIKLGWLTASTGYDYIDVNGDITLYTNSLLDLDFFGAFNKDGLSDGDYFDIFQYTGLLYGEFGSINFTDAALTPGLWSLDYGYDFGGGSRSIRLSYTGDERPYVPTPEPSTMLLLVSVMAGLWVVRRRLNRSAGSGP